MKGTTTMRESQTTKGANTMKRGWKAAIGMLTAAVVLAGEMNVHAATADVGQVSSYEFDWFHLPDYVTTYTGKVPKSTPTKRVVRTAWGSTEGVYYMGKGKYKYDSKGNISKGAGRVFKYDKNGNLIKEILLQSNGKVASWTEYDVDSNGQILRASHKNKSEGEYGYSTYTYKKGRVVKCHSAFIGGREANIKYKYNSVGNLTTVVSADYKNTYTYDANGRLTAVHIDRGSNSALDYQFSYDNDGYLARITQLHYTDGVDAYTDFIYETISPTHKTKKK